MTTSTIATYLQYANLQMAAEAFLVNPDGSVKDDLKTELKNGNAHASRFTDTGATEFLKHWDIVNQEANTSTGFSGTLFKCKEADPLTGAKVGDCVISFRSTEFIDDAINDCQTTNKTIKSYGWGFGQIADMQDWYARIQSQITGPLSVTGYSLGGHLAIAFNTLYEGAATATYTFNGAGVGKLKDGSSLNTVMSTFNTVWNNKTHNENLFSSAATRSLYTELVARQADHGLDQFVRIERK